MKQNCWKKKNSTDFSGRHFKASICSRLRLIHQNWLSFAFRRWNSRLTNLRRYSLQQWASVTFKTVCTTVEEMGGIPKHYPSSEEYHRKLNWLSSKRCPVLNSRLQWPSGTKEAHSLHLEDGMDLLSNKCKSIHSLRILGNCTPYCLKLLVAQRLWSSIMGFTILEEQIVATLLRGAVSVPVSLLNGSSWIQ